MKKHYLAAFGALALLSSPTFAADTEADIGLVAELGLEFGGDPVDTVIFTDNTTQDVKSGQGLTFALGMHYRPQGWPVGFSGTVGYKFVSTQASNADIRITRTVVEFLTTYDPKDAWWVAAGPVWHNGVEFDTDGFGANQDLGSSTGYTIQGGWRWFGLKYTDMEYQEEGRFRRKYDASVVGIVFRWRG